MSQCKVFHITIESWTSKNVKIPKVKGPKRQEWRQYIPSPKVFTFEKVIMPSSKGWNHQNDIMMLSSQVWRSEGITYTPFKTLERH